MNTLEKSNKSSKNLLICFHEQILHKRIELYDNGIKQWDTNDINYGFAWNKMIAYFIGGNYERDN